MEGLSLFLEEVASNSLFSYHPTCSVIKLSHLCFADDLLIFSAATLASIRCYIGVLAQFEALSGLKANLPRVQSSLLELPLLLNKIFLSYCICRKGSFL
jgi:hypothetical protein